MNEFLLNVSLIFLLILGGCLAIYLFVLVLAPIKTPNELKVSILVKVLVGLWFCIEIYVMGENSLRFIFMALLGSQIVIFIRKDLHELAKLKAI